MLVHHKGLDPERWFKFSLMEQLANVGSDIERTISWRNKGNIEYSTAAFERALELMNLTIADKKNRGLRLRELARARETMLDYFLGDNQYNTTDAQWQSYFYDFAYAAALARGK